MKYFLILFCFSYIFLIFFITKVLRKHYYLYINQKIINNLFVYFSLIPDYKIFLLEFKKNKKDIEVLKKILDNNILYSKIQLHIKYNNTFVYEEGMFLFLFLYPFLLIIKKPLSFLTLKNIPALISIIDEKNNIIFQTDTFKNFITKNQNNINIKKFNDSIKKQNLICIEESHDTNKILYVKDKPYEDDSDLFLLFNSLDYPIIVLDHISYNICFFNENFYENFSSDNFLTCVTIKDVLEEMRIKNLLFDSLNFEKYKSLFIANIKNKKNTFLTSSNQLTWNIKPIYLKHFIVLMFKREKSL
jgi:hypothetical protein